MKSLFLAALLALPTAAAAQEGCASRDVLTNAIDESGGVLFARALSFQNQMLEIWVDGNGEFIATYTDAFGKMCIIDHGVGFEVNVADLVPSGAPA